MIKLGVCTSVDNINSVATLGFDYLEWSFMTMAALPDDEFERVVALVEAAPIKVYAFNGMVPPSIPLTGPNVDWAAVEAYVDGAFARAQRLGGRVVVFGSGGARRVPEGFPMDEAWRQLAQFLKLCVPYAERAGMKLAIEPLRRKECNILNLVAEGMAIASLVNKPAIGVLADTFHMNETHEPYDAIVNAGRMLYHAHIGHTIPGAGRDFPYPGDGMDYTAVFNALKAIDYAGGVSIEAGTQDLMREGAVSLAVLREAMR